MRDIGLAASTPLVFLAVMTAAVVVELDLAPALATAFLIASLVPFPLTLVWFRPTAPHLAGQPYETGRTLGWDWLRFHDATVWVNAETAALFRANPAEVALEAKVAGFELEVPANEEAGIPWDAIGSHAMMSASIGFGTLWVMGVLIGMVAGELSAEDAVAVLAALSVAMVMLQALLHAALAFACKMATRTLRSTGSIHVRTQGNLLDVDGTRFTLGHPDQEQRLYYGPRGTTLTLRNPDQRVQITGNHAAVCRLADYAASRDQGEEDAVPASLRALRSTSANTSSNT